MNTKRCPDCKQNKMCADFSKNSYRKGGLQTICKSCASIRKKAWKKSHPGQSAADISYYRTHKTQRNTRRQAWRKRTGRDSGIGWTHKTPEQIFKWTMAWHKRVLESPDKYKSSIQKVSKKCVEAAVKLGILTNPGVCQHCGSSQYVQGHHWDYSKPLEVDWCCKKCHCQFDKIRKEQGHQ